MRLNICDVGSHGHQEGLQQLEALGAALPASWHWRHVVSSAGERLNERAFWVSVPHPTAPLGVLISVARSRRVPWANIAHVEQLGDAYFAEHAARVARMLLLGVQSLGRVMRLNIRLLHLNEQVRGSLGTAFADEGGERVSSPSMYTQTHVLDVQDTAAQMFTRLPARTKRRIREPGKHGLVVRTNAVVLQDIPRLIALMDASFARTGGQLGQKQRVHDLSRAVHNPQHYPLVTLEHAERTDNERIVAFALGAYNGDHVTYCHGASARGEGLSGGLSLSDAPVWALVEWGVNRGVSWVDLGGISPVDSPDDPLAGISAFKRNFGGRDAHVADEWRLTLNRFNVRLETYIGKLRGA